MSFVVTALLVDDETIQPTSGGDQAATTGDDYAITDPRTRSGDPATITAPDTGSFSAASGTVGANVYFEGNGNATINIGNAFTEDVDDRDTDPDLLNASGSRFQVADDYQGQVNVNLAGAIVDGVNKVDTSSDATGGGTIASNLPGGGRDSDGNDIEIDYYVNAGAANDKIQGSRGDDFLRAGAGDDTVDGGRGDDILRLGTGDDVATLGQGEDTVYFTVDQLQLNGQTKTITDFVSGQDKLTFAADTIANPGGYSLSADGKTLTLTFSKDGGTFTTTIVSQGDAFDPTNDLEFL